MNKVDWRVWVRTWLGERGDKTQAQNDDITLEYLRDILHLI